ncbi:MAG: ectoine/hydroxyectoine ABC transporter substrate-binding protein EhuB [Actinomycetota bacterium]
MRDRKRRPWSRQLLSLLAVLALVGGACASEDTGEQSLLEELQEQGSVRIGIANEVPYGYEDEDGNVTGEAPEVAKAVLAELGIDDVEAVVVDFGSLIPGLQAGRFDMIAAGMFINAERAEQMIFSDPDYCVSESFAVPEGNPDGLVDYPSVVENPDVTIAILSGAVEEGYAETAGVPDDQIELFPDVNAQYDALEAGRVDAVTGTFLTVKTQTDDMDGFEAVDPFFPLDSYPDGEPILGCGGFGFLDQEFRDAFNAELKNLQADGTVKGIVTSFGFAEEDVDLAEGLTVEDLVEDTEDTEDAGDGEESEEESPDAEESPDESDE